MCLMRQGCFRIGHPGLQYDVLDGAPDAECAFVFAQFEREVTAERIRDKVAASKRKGMWMGGAVPMGYDARDKALVVNQSEAKAIQTIFAEYLIAGSVRQLSMRLAKLGVVSKQRPTVRTYAEHSPFARCALQHTAQPGLHRQDPSQGRAARRDT